MGRKQDIAGQRFGRWSVLRDTNQRSGSGQIMYECQCDCGQMGVIRGDQLRSGRSTSCGCFRLEGVAELGTRNAYSLQGRVFGRLTVTSRNGSCLKQQALWVCICQCGNTLSVPSVRLVSGWTKSCGCLQVDTVIRNRAFPHLAVADVSGYRTMLQAIRKVEKCLTQTK